MKKILALLLSMLMLVGIMPISAFATNDYTINSAESSDEYYNLISKQDWEIAPGITESQIVLNNDDGSQRQVLFVMEADLNNEYVKVANSYMGMVPEYGNYKVAGMSMQAAWAEANGYGNVVGAMNTTLSWYSGYSADRVNEPLGFIMLDAEVLFDPGNCGYDYGNVGFPSVLVINKDFDDEGNPRPDDIPKVEMPQIRSAADLDGWEDQVIPCSSGYIVKDGVNINSVDHTDAAPRSVVGIKPDGTVVIMLNDGRQSPYSAGMSMYELAEVMLDLGCSYAVNCDGGGSSTYLSQRPGEELKINNIPSDGVERDTTTGILFISTAPATGEFDRATISTSSEFYTPGSEVAFAASGSDLVGTPADIPADATWVLSDSSFGTISNDGVFASNGKVGSVSAQLIYNGEVKGEKEITIAWPTEFSFASQAMTVPYGKKVSIEFVATYNGSENYVELKPEDIEFALSDSSLGTINGFAFTANSEEDAGTATGTLTATINGLSSVTAINLGKGSEVIFDFENNAVEDWFLYDYNVTHSGDKTNPSWDMKNEFIEVVNSETGKVHSGNNAFAVTVDYSDAYSNGWIQYRLGYSGEYFEIKNAKKIGFWIWMPEEAYANEYDYVIACVDSNGNGAKLTGVLTDIGYCFQNQDEAGWRYFSIDISKYPIAYFGSRSDITSTFYLQFYNYQPQWKHDDEVVNTQGKFTYFIDDITIEYSDAADDTDAPVFGTMNIVDNNGVISEMKGQTVGYNTFGAEVTVQDFVKANSTGIDPASAKAYIDGKEINCTYSNGRLSVSGITVADGLHTVKFVICDKMGNLNSIVKQVTVNAGSDIPTINLVPHDADLTELPSGSVYYIDLVASNVESVQKFVVDLDMVNTFTWHLEHSVVADGFEMSYSLEKYENVATITITKNGNVTATGSQIIASIPVRVWEASIDRGLLTSSVLKEVYLTVKCTRGILECIDGTVSTFTCDPMKVATELWMNQWNAPTGFAGVTLHKHTEVALEDKSANCTENGYVGRTYCEECDSVVEWGETIPATGHDYVLVDGVYVCENCGDENGAANGLVENDGVYGYYIDGVAQSGWVMVDSSWHYFHADTLAAKAGKYAVDGIEYEFEETGKLVSGVWAKTLYGTRYFYGPGCYGTGWATIDGNRYYFHNTYRYEGYRMIFKAKIRRWYNFGDDGICREDEVINGFCWDADNGLGYVVDNIGVDGLQKIDGDYYFFNYYGYAVSGFANVGLTNCDLPTGNYYFGEDYKAYTGLVEKNGVTYYYENGRAKLAGLVEIDGDIYFAGGSNGEITVDKKVYVWQGNGILPEAYYEFGSDGKILNGIVDKDGTLYYYKNGKPTAAGLVEIDGAIYFAGGSNGEITVDKKVYVWQGNGILPEGNYEFGSDGNLCKGIVEKDGVLYYYENGQPKMAGLVEIDGDYYFAGGSKGEITVNKMTYVWKANGIALDNANCEFGADGKMLNGIVEKDGTLYYYSMGRPRMAGLIEIDGDYYFAGGSNGEITVNKMTYVWKANGIALDNANCEFGADGKMLNGIVEKNGTLYYYVMGRPRMAGLVEYDGALYFAGGSNGEITVNKKTYVWKSNGILPEGNYEFGADGKMLNGIVEKNGTLYYYENGKAQLAGLVEYDGAYYFVSGVNGEITVNKKTYVWDGNGILPEDNYEFGADGKMLNGFVTKDDGIYYYSNGKPGRVGLNYIDGYYYFVNYGGKLFTSGTYFVWETNGYSIGMRYTFDDLGRLILK